MNNFKFYATNNLTGGISEAMREYAIKKLTLREVKPTECKVSVTPTKLDNKKPLIKVKFQYTDKYGHSKVLEATEDTYYAAIDALKDKVKKNTKLKIKEKPKLSVLAFEVAFQEDN